MGENVQSIRILAILGLIVGAVLLFAYGAQAEPLEGNPQARQMVLGTAVPAIGSHLFRLTGTGGHSVDLFAVRMPQGDRLGVGVKGGLHRPGITLRWQMR